MRYPGSVYKLVDDVWERDVKRTHIAISNGFDVLRVWEYDIHNNKEKTFEKIFNYLKGNND